MKFTWKNVSDVLSDKELKNALGGYGDGYGYNKAYHLCCRKPDGPGCVCEAIIDACTPDLMGDYCMDVCGMESGTATCAFY